MKKESPLRVKQWKEKPDLENTQDNAPPGSISASAKE